MAEIRNWYLAMTEGKLTAHGEIYFSDRIEDGKTIMTTEVKEITYLADRLRIHTRNSEYDLPYASHRTLGGADTNTIPVEYLQGRLEDLDISRWTEGAVEERREKEKAEMGALIPETEENGAVLRFSSRSTYYYLAMIIKKNGRVRYTDSCTVRLGTYTDSVLIDGTIPGTHFAYYPKYESIEFYSWDEALEPVYLQNAGHVSLTFKKDAETFTLAPGEIRRVGD